MSKHKNGISKLASAEFVLIPTRNGRGVIIDREAVPCRTFNEIVLAEEAMRAAGIDALEVFSGDPDGDHVKTGAVLTAEVES